jgi:hypothetical protein
MSLTVKRPSTKGLPLQLRLWKYGKIWRDLSKHLHLSLPTLQCLGSALIGRRSRGEADWCGADSEANGASPPTLTPAAAEVSESPSSHLLSWFGATEFLRKNLQNLQARHRKGPLTVGEVSELKQMEIG